MNRYRIICSVYQVCRSKTRNPPRLKCLEPGNQDWCEQSSVILFVVLSPESFVSSNKKAQTTQRGSDHVMIPASFRVIPVSNP